MHRITLTLSLLAVLTGRTSLAEPAKPLAEKQAETSRTVDHPRLKVQDLVPHAPPGIALLDLGPTPPPGSSRLVSRAEVLGHVRDAGADITQLSMPAVVRVVGAARRYSMDELAEAVSPAIGQALWPGVSLVKAEPTYELVVSPRATFGKATVPRPPRHQGAIRTTATVEMMCDEEVVARVQVPVRLEVSGDASHADVERGARIALIIEHGTLRVSTYGSAMLDGNVGDVVNVMVQSTSRVVKARIVSKDEATVVEGS